jgi:tetratricopeptide (TPR) repeat protein
MAKTIALSIEIDGLSDLTKQVVGLEMQLEKLNTELKQTEKGSEEYINLRNQIAATNEQLIKAKKEQKDFIKSAEGTKAAEGSYYQLNQQLVDLRKQYKNLSAAERNAAKGQELKTKIQQLDTELKKIDESTGQFQRNVGNYPKTFALINRSLTRTIPGFEAFSEQLKDSQGNINGFGKALVGGFVAFQGAKLIGQAIQKLDQFISKINETKDTVAQFSGAYGEDLDTLTASTTALAETFNTDARTISAAAEALSKNLGIGFEEALSKLEGTLVEGRGNADDYLKAITEYPQAFKTASGEISDFSEKNRDAVNTNRELALSQIETAKRIEKSTGGISNFGKQLETGFFLVIAEIIDLFKPLTDGFTRLSTSFTKVFENLKLGGVQFNFLGVAVKFLLGPLTGIATLFPILLNALASWYDIVGNVIKQSPFLQSVFANVGAAITNVIAVFNDIPNVFAGVVSALQQVGVAFVNTFQSLFLEAQIFAEQVKGVFGANVKSAIEDLRKQQAEIGKAGMTIAEAFSKGYNDAKKSGDEKRVEQDKKTGEKILKVDLELLKKQQEAAKQAADKLQQARDKYAEDEIKNAQEKSALLLELQTRLQEEIVKNIKDNRERELAEVQLGLQKEKAALQKQYDDVVLAAKNREAELAKVFGENSAEVLKAQEDNKNQLIEVKRLQKEIEVQIEQDAADKTADINDTYRKAELEKAEANLEQLKQWRDEALTSELDFIEEAGDMRILKNEETLNKQLAQEKDAKKRELLVRLAEEKKILDEIEKLKLQLRAVDDQEQNLKDQAAKGVQIKQEEYDAVAKARQQLNTKLSDAELKYKDMVKKTGEEIKDERIKQLQQIAEYIQQGLQFIDQVLSVINARAEKQVEEQLARSSERQEKLNEELENATGLRRQFLQQQLDNEIENEKKLAKEQERIQLESARRSKALAIIQSIINTALAVSTALIRGNPVAALLAGVAGAAQTAIIAAQPLAEGGAVVPVGLPDSGGKVVGVQNIPQTSKGDNVLVAARVGETFLNAKQTKMLRPALSAAKVPGFANGGLLGAPNIGGIGNSTLRAFNDRTTAISGQVLDSKVYLVTDELHRDTREGERIRKKVTLR